jgi:hypothetical protein
VLRPGGTLAKHVAHQFILAHIVAIAGRAGAAAAAVAPEVIVYSSAVTTNRWESPGSYRDLTDAKLIGAKSKTGSTG